jgi:hypothetical protein
MASFLANSCLNQLLNLYSREEKCERKDTSVHNNTANCSSSVMESVAHAELCGLLSPAPQVRRRARETNSLTLSLAIDF